MLAAGIAGVWAGYAAGGNCHDFLCQGATFNAWSALVVGGVVGAAFLLFFSRRDPEEDQKNEMDYRRARVLRGALEEASMKVDETTTGVFVTREMRLGELIRQFDVNTVATMRGWLEHQFHVEGWGGGVRVGGLGVGIGSVSLPGQSTLQGTIEGTARADQLGDGFVAVLEDDLGGRPETIRIVVPSESAAHEMTDRLLSRTEGAFPIASHSALAISAFKIDVWQAFNTEISHAADRLAAVLRMKPDRRPLVRVAGIELAPHVILGGALRIAGDESWMQLLPVGLFLRLQDGSIVRQAMEEAPVEHGALVRAVALQRAAGSSVSGGGAAASTLRGRIGARSVVLLDRGRSVIETIKAVRQITGLGLKEAKDLVDQSPSVVGSGLTSGEAEAIRAILEAAGAPAEVR